MNNYADQLVELSMRPRAIMFRGKRMDNGEWVCSRSILTVLQDNKYLHFIPQQGEDFKAEPNEKNGRILTTTKGNYYQVDYETIGQYTGLTDKNGKKIFEGDVVAVPKNSYVKSPPYLFNDTIKGVIEFGRYNQSCYEKEKTNLGYYIKWFSDNEAVRNMLRKDIVFWFSEHFNEIMVIGNIHDNPELLEVEECPNIRS